MAFGFGNDKVRLVPLDADRHLENYYRWINDPELTETLSHGDIPLTIGAEREWFENISKGSETDIVFALETPGGIHIGTTGIHGIDYRQGTANTGSYIADPSQRGQGFGTEAALLRSDYAFRVLGLRMLKSSYFEGNIGSEKMQTRAGYVEYGRLPKAAWKRGEYRTMIYTYLTRQRWEEMGNAIRCC